MIDRNKPVQTRDGRKVVIYCWDAPGLYPIHGRVEACYGPISWTTDGRPTSFEHAELELVNVPEGKVRYYVIAERAGYASFADANNAKKGARHGGNVLKVTWAEGKPVKIEDWG